MGGANRSDAVRDSSLAWPKVATMQTVMSELVLMTLLLGVVVLSGWL
jgi:hypothetical protein